MKSYRSWTYETVIAEVLHCARNAYDLSYTNMRKQYPALTRASERLFGSWRKAVEAAGLDYEAIRRYKIWNRERIIQRIQYWHAQQADLSWYNVSVHLDPALAAAVQHGRYVSGWAEALRLAGFDPQQIYRYKKWTLQDIQQELSLLQQEGTKLDQDTLAIAYPALLAAIYRVGGGLMRVRATLGSLPDTPVDHQAQQNTTDVLQHLHPPIYQTIRMFGRNGAGFVRNEH